MARALHAAGHEVVLTFTRDSAAAYEDVSARRLAIALASGRAVFGCRFGSDAMFDLITREEPFDVLCHHAAEVTDYRSPDFNPWVALERNTHRLTELLPLLRRHGCRRIVLTGTVFEADEGAGDGDRPAFSPYGLSKTLTWHTVRHYARTFGLRLGKFVIANPFGPLEKPSFTSFLAKSWLNGQTPEVRYPDYVRDNIPVSLLALAYADFVEEVGRMDPAGEPLRCNPTGYAESQGAFARRFAAELRPRLQVPCELQFLTQQDFSEPRIRISTEVCPIARRAWDESQAWDELAQWYLEAFTVGDRANDAVARPGTVAGAGAPGPRNR